MYHPFLVGGKLYLRAMEQKDLDGKYFDWLNDYEVTRYIDSGFFPNSIESMQQYFNDTGRSNNNVLLCIIDLKTDKHIGNIRLGPINWINRNSFIGVMIGEKSFWGKGYACEAIKLVLNYAFARLNLHRLSAGVNACNVASLKAFEKSGFKIEGRKKEEIFAEGKYHDGIIVGLIKE